MKKYLCIKKHFTSIIYFIALLFISSCAKEASLPITLDDRWEGEKDFISCEIEVNKNAEVIISKTFNPVFSEKEPLKYVSEYTIHLFRNGLIYDTLKYNFDKNKYIGNRPVQSQNIYKLFIFNGIDTIKSKSLYVPLESFKLTPIRKEITEDSIKLDFDILFNKESEGFLEAYMFIMSPAFLIPDFNSNKINSLSSCFKDKNTVDISCIKGEKINMFLKTKYDNRLKIDSTTYIVLGIKHYSPELYELRKGRISPSFGISKDNIIKTSFDSAYGIFGYSKNTYIEELLIK